MQGRKHMYFSCMQARKYEEDRSSEKYHRASLTRCQEKGMAIDKVQRELTVFLLAQMMDLSVDAWGVVRRYMNLMDWGKACTTSRASYAMKRDIVVACLHSEQHARSLAGTAEQLCMEQLQLDRWPKCHCLWLNLHRLPQEIGLSQAQIDEIKKASEALPLLRCLHVVGRNYPNVATESSIEAVLIDSLARHASVLMLKYVNMRVPFDLPILQHLVLEFKPLDTRSITQNYGPVYENPFAAISRLENLKTLYIHYHRYCPFKAFRRRRHTLRGDADLTGCVHLQNVTLRDVTFQGKLVLTACMGLQHVTLQDVTFRGELALPAGCPVQVINERSCLIADIGTLAEQVTALTVHTVSDEDLQPWRCILGKNWLLQCTPAITLHKLKRLQVNLRKEDFADGFTRGEEKVLTMIVEDVPTLEIFEVDMQCNLSLYTEFGHRLTSLVIIASGTLQIDGLHRMPASKQTYLQSGGAFKSPSFKLAAKYPFEREIFLGVRFDDHVRFWQHGWIVQMPANFQPSNLKQCYCGACPSCLAQAGVPILCKHA